MSDFLLELSQRPAARKLIQSTKLPIPMPAVLDRPCGPAVEQVLKDQLVVVGGEGEVTDLLAHVLVLAGADAYVLGDAMLEAFRAPGEAYGRRPRRLTGDEMPTGIRVKALVFDATGLATTADLKQAYQFLKPRVRSLAQSGRVLIVGRPPEGAEGTEQAAVHAALEGLVRSVAKEIGKNGSTANLIYVARGAEERMPAVASFLLSSASAFVTGQPLRVTNAVQAAIQSGPRTRELSGKVALVTGGARGIGAATAEILAMEGAHVVVLDRPADDAQASEVARKIGGTVLLVDVAAAEAPSQVATFLKQHFGGVDVVVHNAGVTRDKMLANMVPEIWDQCIDINLAAVLRITDALTGSLLRPGGRVICLSSIAGLAGNSGQTNYAASKSGVVGFVKALAPKLEARGVSVNAVAPGFIETRLTAAIPVAIREVARRLSALGQGGEPADVGQAIRFLASPGSLGVTGQVLRVCGGAFVGA